jgi:hypothetical protein
MSRNTSDELLLKIEQRLDQGIADMRQRREALGREGWDKLIQTVIWQAYTSKRHDQLDIAGLAMIGLDVVFRSQIETEQLEACS